MVKIYFLFISFLYILLSCSEAPSDADLSNPFDYKNSKTQGDPLNITAEFLTVPMRVELGWNNFIHERMQHFRVYKAVEEKQEFQAIGLTNSTSFTDNAVYEGNINLYRVVVVDTEGNESPLNTKHAVRVILPPLIWIDDNHFSTASTQITLGIRATAAVRMWISNSRDFTDGAWESFKTERNWTIPDEEGFRIVYIKTSYANNSESPLSADGIYLDKTPPVAVCQVSPTSGTLIQTFAFYATSSTDNISKSEDLQIRYDWEDDGTFDTDWQNNITVPHQFTSRGTKTVKLEVMDEAGLTGDCTSQVTVN